MLSIGKIGGAKGSAHVDDYQSYILSESEKHIEDYYRQDGGTGRFAGKLADELGLAGTFDSDKFARLLRGYHPTELDEHGEPVPLTQNVTLEKRVAAFDLTTSAPRDVSLLASILPEDQSKQLWAAIRRANDKAMEIAESTVIGSRIGKSGVDLSYTSTGKMLRAEFVHGTSRPVKVGDETRIDPNGHVHNTVFNLTLREDGSWGTLDGEKIYEMKMALGAAYRAELAKELRELGYEIETYQEKGHTLLRLRDVPPEVTKEFASRSSQIEERKQQYIRELLDDPAVNEEVKAWLGTASGQAKIADSATIETRAGKSADIDPQALRRDWVRRATEKGLTLEQATRLQKEPPTTEPEPLSAEAVKDALNERMESTFRRRDIIEICQSLAIERGIGADAAMRVADEVLTSDHVLNLGMIDSKEARYTTRETYLLEKELAAKALERKDETHLRFSESEVKAAIAEVENKNGYRLKAEQVAAVRHCLAETGGYALRDPHEFLL